MKYNKFNELFGDSQVYDNGAGISGYKTNRSVGQYYLVINGYLVATKNNMGYPVNYTKWISDWRTNAYKNITNIAFRIKDLEQEREEIMKLIGRSTE